MESTAACLSPRSGVTAPIADPFVSLKRRNVRDRMLIRCSQFEINFLCVLFLRVSAKFFYSNISAQDHFIAGRGNELSYTKILPEMAPENFAFSFSFTMPD
jgi:hypothetical protein